jgi:hypothetical protein
MKRVFLSWRLLLSGFLLTGQSGPALIGPAGDTYQTAELNLEWSLGEAAVETFYCGDGIITEGFHQSILPLQIVKPEDRDLMVNRPQTGGYEVLIFPNPVRSLLTVGIADVEAEGEPVFFLHLLNANGRLVGRRVELRPPGEIEFDLTACPAGLYLLILHDNQGVPLAQYRIVKIF